MVAPMTGTSRSPNNHFLLRLGGHARQQVGGELVGAVAWVEFSGEVVESVSAGVPAKFVCVDGDPFVRPYGPSPTDKVALRVDLHDKFTQRLAGRINL